MGKGSTLQPIARSFETEASASDKTTRKNPRFVKARRTGARKWTKFQAVLDVSAKTGDVNDKVLNSIQATGTNVSETI